MVFKWKSSVKETLERPSERQRWPVKTRCSFLSLQWYSEWKLVPWSDVSPGNVHCGAWQPTREIHKANCVKTSGKDGVTSCESWPVDRHRPVVFLFKQAMVRFHNRTLPMTVVFSLVCMQDVWPPDAKWSLKLKFQHTGNWWSKNCTRKGYAQFHHQLFNRGNTMQLITSKTIILAE